MKLFKIFISIQNKNNIFITSGYYLKFILMENILEFIFKTASGTIVTKVFFIK